MNAAHARTPTSGGSAPTDAPRAPPLHVWNLRSSTLELGRRTLIMGVLNVTPDSFSDGGRWTENAVDHALEMIDAGADILDIGGESTRPGAEPVEADEELRRVMPVIESLAGRIRVPISIDTYKAVVARRALDSGAAIVNDIRGLADGDMALAVAQAGAGLVIMHCPISPKVMKRHTEYDDVTAEVIRFLRAAADRAVDAGVGRSQMVADPGIGFAKTSQQSALLIERLPEIIAAVGLPMLLGPSRKSFLASASNDVAPDKRVWSTAGAVAYGIARGAAIVRVHDVGEMVQVARVCDLIRNARR